MASKPSKIKPPEIFLGSQLDYEIAWERQKRLRPHRLQSSFFSPEKDVVEQQPDVIRESQTQRFPR